MSPKQSLVVIRAVLAATIRRRRVNRDRARRPDTASLGLSVRGSCPTPSAGWRDPRRTGDQVVRGNRQSVTTARNQPPALARANAQTGFAHQSSNPVPTTRMPHGRQLGLDSATLRRTLSTLIQCPLSPGQTLFPQGPRSHIGCFRFLPRLARWVCVRTMARTYVSPGATRVSDSAVKHLI